jgi:hypothetical protein
MNAPFTRCGPHLAQTVRSVQMRVENGFQPVSVCCLHFVFRLIPLLPQIPFSEENPFTSDQVLPSLLKRILPER